MQLQANDLHHLGLRVTDIEASKRFYVDQLGFQSVRDIEGLSLIRGYGVVVGLRSTGRQAPFDVRQAGLDHIALGTSDEALDEIKAQLDAVGVANNGIQDDELTGARYICFYDPDGIPWEFYSMPS